MAPSRWGDRAASHLELALLAGGDARVLRQTRQLVETATWDIQAGCLGAAVVLASRRDVGTGLIAPSFVGDDGLALRTHSVGPVRNRHPTPLLTLSATAAGLYAAGAYGFRSRDLAYLSQSST